jgi:hypothetical protein
VNNVTNATGTGERENDGGKATSGAAIRIGWPRNGHGDRVENESPARVRGKDVGGGSSS